MEDGSFFLKFERKRRVNKEETDQIVKQIFEIALINISFGRKKK